MESPADRFISGDDVDQMFNITKNTRYRYIENGVIPKPIKFGKTSAKWSFQECVAAFERMKAAPRQGATQ